MEEYSSGCESGWTVYFEQSACFEASRECEDRCVNRFEDETTEEEDLSMVSDASSGPAHVSQDQDAACYMNGISFNNIGGFYSVSTDEDAALVKSRERKSSRQRSKQPRRRDERLKQQQQAESHLLDDTASSRADFNYSMMNNTQAPRMHQMLDFSQQDHFSTSYFQGDASSAAMQNHYNQQVQHHQQQQYYW